MTVFKLLSECDCLDTFGPAKRQFDGRGSYGNGGAMRISPAALFVNRKSYDFSKLKVWNFFQNNCCSTILNDR